MTCDEFLEMWNERLDDRTPFAPIERLDEHAASCEKCRVIASAFRAMTLELRPPTPPPELTDRIVLAWAESQRRPRILPFVPRWAAAVGLVAATFLLSFTVWKANRPTEISVAVEPVPTVRPWTESLAHATTATWTLARETSAPAARFGQDVLEAGNPGDLSWPILFETPRVGTSDKVEAVSKTLNSQVKPLSGTARRAFSFLMAPAPRKADDPRSGA